MSIQVKTCKNCIGNMAKYCARCQNCFEHDNYMTKNQMSKLKNELLQAESKKNAKIKNIQLNRIKFLCGYIKAGYRHKDDAIIELKNICNMRKNKNYNKVEK